MTTVSLKAQSFSFDHPNCQVRLKSFPKDQQYLRSTLSEELSKRNFESLPMKDDKRVLPGDMYFNLEVVKLPSKLYHPCLVKIKFKVAKNRNPSASDKTIFQKEIKRTFPRVTLNGKERCKKALKDSFVHIPYCKKL